MGTRLPSLQKGHSSRSPSSARLLWPSGWMDQDTTWYSGRPRPRPHYVRWGPSSLLKGHSSPPLLTHVYCGQTVAHLTIVIITMILYVFFYFVANKLSLSLSQQVLSSCLSYAFGPMSCLCVLSCLCVMLVYCCQMVGWIMMPVGTEVGLGPGVIVLDGDPAPSKGTEC